MPRKLSVIAAALLPAATVAALSAGTLTTADAAKPKAVGTDLTASVPARADAGTKISVTGTLTTAKGAPVVGRDVVVMTKAAGGSWTDARSDETARRGAYDIRLKVTETVQVKVVFEGTRRLKASAASAGVVTVKAGGGSSTPSALSIVTKDVDDAYQGEDYSLQLKAKKSSGDVTWKVTAGDLPRGLSLSKSGLISGWTAVEIDEYYDFTVKATDASGGSDTASYELYVDESDLELVTEDIPDATAGAPYSVQFASDGGTAPYSYALTESELPAGITLSTSGLLSGTSTETGYYEFTVVVTDARGVSYDDFFVLAIV